MKETTICLTGYRPDKIFGHNVDVDNAEYDSLHDRLNLILFKYIQNGYRINAHSGMALGADTIWAEEIVKMKKRKPHQIRFIADIPSLNQTSAWNKQVDRDRYQKLIQYADKKIIYSDTNDSIAMFKRNRGMVNASDTIIAVSKQPIITMRGGTSNTIRYFIRKSHAKNFFLINPFDNFIRIEQRSLKTLYAKKSNKFKTLKEVQNYFARMLQTCRIEGYEITVHSDFFIVHNSKNQIKTIYQFVCENQAEHYQILVIKKYIKKHEFLINTENIYFKLKNDEVNKDLIDLSTNLS